MRHRRSVPLFVALVAATTAGAFDQPPIGRVLVDYDIRSAGVVPAVPTPDARAGLRALERRSETELQVRWGRNGAVRWVHAEGRPLTAAEPMASPVRARQLLGDPTFGYGAAGPQTLELLFEATTPVAGASKPVRHVGFLELQAGIPIYQGYARVDIDSQGRIVAVGTSGQYRATTASARPGLTAQAALPAALQAAGASPRAFEAPGSQAARTIHLRVAGFARRIPASLTWLVTDQGALLAWRFQIPGSGYPALYDILIDANDGTLLLRTNLMAYLDTRANVFVESPDHGPRSMELIYDRDINVQLAWPDGWLFADRSDGNNVIAREDRDGDDETTLGTLATATAGTPQLFDPTYTGDPLVDVELSVANLFWSINTAHGYFHGLGFDEASGNFQVANFGRGGAESDPVRGDAQDDAATLLDADPMNDVKNNANFQTPADGESPRMQMYLWDYNTPGTWRDSSLDLDVVIHEFAHGVSNRLVGGRTDATCLLLGQSGAMGEGWGDYFAGSYNLDPVVGEHSTQDFTNGIRTAPMSADSYTYGDLCTIAMGGCEVHADGEIWAQALWEIRAALSAVNGPSGRRIADQLAIDGMKFSICRPSFLDMRDAILLADSLRYAAAHHCLLWQVFAQNGMGRDAVDNTAGNYDMPQEDFTVPDDCQATVGLGTIRWQFATIGCDDQATITVVDADLTLPTTVDVRSAAGDLLTLDLLATGSPGTFTAGPFPVQGVASPTDVVLGDSILQGVRGDTLSVDYLDRTNSGRPSASASLLCQADVALGRYRFARASCDDDTVPGFPELPGFLDAGESAELLVELVNQEAFQLDDVLVGLSSSNPLVRVVPSGPLALGSLEPARGTATTPRLVRFLATADPAVMTGDTTDLTMSFSARGFDGPTIPLQWTVRLNLDYQVATRRFSEDFEPTSPTVAAWSHAETRTPPNGDQWQIVTCAAGGGVRSYKNGGGDPMCGNYSDTQGDPYLASPPFRVIAPGSEAAQLTRLQFLHLVQLAVPSDPFGGICDAEAVAVVVTNDPATIDTMDPLALLANAIAGYTVIPLLGLDDNTVGFEVQDLDLSNVPLAGVDLNQDIYLSWVFAIDITNSFVPAPGCSFFNRQGEGYYLDDVVLEWQEITVVPQAAPCTVACLALALAEPPSVSSCAGRPTDLSGGTSQITNCAGGIEYRWSGGELGPPGPFGPIADTTVMPSVAERYLLEVACVGDPGCTHGAEVLVVPGLAPPVGGFVDNALRLTRQASNAHLDWTLGVLSPRTYNIHATGTRQDVVDLVIIAGAPVLQPTDTEVADLPLPVVDTYWEVFGRDGCTGVSVIP